MAEVSLMARYPLILEKHLHRGGCDPHIHLLSDQLIGYAIVMAVNLDMIVDIDPGLFPFGVLIPARRKGFECGLVQGLEKVSAGGIEFFKPAVIQVRESVGNGLIELGNAEEGMVSQRCQDPSLSHKDR